MSKPCFLLSAVVALTSTLVGCGDDPARPGEALTPDRVAELCAATCDVGVACDPAEYGATVAECRTVCDPIASIYRADLFEAFTACFTELTCAEWPADDRCSFILEQATPTPAGEAYIAACAAAVTRCFDADSEPCDPLMGKLLNDRVLGEFTACFNADSCEAVETCSLAVSRKYNLDR